MGNRGSAADKTVRVEIGAFSHETARKPPKKQNLSKSTKYTILTFLPQNLFEQFRRVANIYFLGISLISVFIDSPVSPLAVIIPLAVVISVTAVKQGYEDFLRHRADSKVNNAVTPVIRNGREIDLKWQDIAPSDLVRIKRDENIPCDLVPLLTSDNGKCFITTANLDGETNLKTLLVPKGLPDVELSQFHTLGHIVAEAPQIDLYTFNGRLELTGNATAIPLSAENLMLRGSRVKNTEWVIACAVYTGKDSKLSLNSKITKNKMSSSEHIINKFLFFFVIFLLTIVTFSYFVKRYFDINHYHHFVYLGDATLEFFQDYFSFVILFYYLIPISLYVTIELHKFFNSFFLSFDYELYDEESDQPCIVNTSDLNEELGQINILFSDKTGTLTKNIMIFKQCSINGKVYLHNGNTLLDTKENCSMKITECPNDVLTFFEALAICHTVQVAGTFNEEDEMYEKPQKFDGVRRNFIEMLDYQASSPDEKALVEACAKLGVIYLRDDDENFSLKIKHGREFSCIRFKSLEVLEFTSDRKRMSAIVKDEEETIWLYTKGAESSVLPLCIDRDSGVAAETDQHITDFAKIGLRTLAVARRKMAKEEYETFSNELNEAKSAIANRIQLVEECQSKIEHDMELLGATAVEDALQDDVRPTLEAIRAAGIKIWVLTGDKVETALSIGQSCGHIPDTAVKYFIVDCKTETEVGDHLTALERELEWHDGTNFALLMDGASLAIAQKHFAHRFRDAAFKCHAVLCCRLSPLQKCEVVHLVKSSPSRPVTCAIGDGANDVSMIQEAHVGIGIIGKEGRQAARCADYAFTNFFMLKRIILVHGYYFAQRMSMLVLYFFYKNMALMGCQVFFQVFSQFSTQSIFDSLFLTVYNIIYTTLPILFLSITEKVYSEEKLTNEPELYKEVSGNRLFGWRYFNSYMLIGFYHSIIIFFFSYFIFAGNAAIYDDGTTLDLMSFGVFLIHNVVVIVNIKLVIEATHKNFWFLMTIGLTILGAMMGLTYMYNLFNAFIDLDLYMVYTYLLSSLSFWVVSLIITVAGLLPDFTFKAFELVQSEIRTLFPGNDKMGTKMF